MTLATTSITITAYCDGYGCNARQAETSGTMTAARSALRRDGWSIVITSTLTRTTATYCHACAKERRLLIAEGILSPQGYVLDEVRYEAHIAARDAAAEATP